VISSVLVAIRSNNLAGVVNSSNISSLGAWEVNGDKQVSDLGEAVFTDGPLEGADNNALVVNASSASGALAGNYDAGELSILEQESILDKSLAINVVADDRISIIDLPCFSPKCAREIEAGKGV
jgi:hypothetical protein